MKELLERMEKKMSAKKKAAPKTMPKRGSIYTEVDVEVTVRLTLKELGRLIKTRTLTVRARDANKEPHVYQVTIELGKRGAAT